MRIERKSINDLNPAEYNPRLDLKPGDEEYEKIKSSILEFDLVEPLVWNERTGNLVGGHQRLKVLKEMGTTEVEVSVVDLDNTREKALNIALNRIQGDWDYPKLLDVLEEIKLDDYDINLTGFSDIEYSDLLSKYKEPEEGLIDDDEIPEPKESVCKTGDLWQLENHRLLCGDATKKEDVERLMAGKKADMVFTDPPYGVNYAEKNRFLNSFQKAGKNLRDIMNDALSKDELFSMLVSAFTNMVTISKNTCTYYVTAPQGGELGLMMMMMSGLPVRHVLIWVKDTPNFSLGRLDYDYQHEPILYAWVKTHIFYGKGQYNKSIWNIPKSHNNKLHPTMKPVALIENALLNSSLPNENIGDYFGGSGSTLIACEKLNRRCFMMEIEPHYCDVIIERWQQFTSKQATKL